MSQRAHQLGVYLHLAQANLRRRRLMLRDRMLLLAGEVASELGLSTVAAFCRAEILDHNPNHLVRRWSTLADALRDEEFLVFLKQVRRRYPSEKAESMLVTLGLEMGNERAVYFSDAEYAAAILGKTPEELESLYGC